MTLPNENKVFRVIGLLWGESAGPRCIPLTEVGDAELWGFLLSAPEQMSNQAIEMPIIWDAIALTMTSL